MTTPQEVYIQDRNSGKVLQYMPDATYEVVIESQSGATSQKWLLTDSGVAGYIYIESKVDGNVITTGGDAKDPLVVSGLPQEKWYRFEPGVDSSCS